MSHDRYIDFEEVNYHELVEEFIKKHRDEWDEFVYDKYGDRPELDPPDRIEEE